MGSVCTILRRIFREGPSEMTFRPRPEESEGASMPCGYSEENVPEGGRASPEAQRQESNGLVC